MRHLLRKWLYRRARRVTGGCAGERAGRLFDTGFNCAQAVLQAAGGTDDSKLLEMAEAFGSGIGGSKCLCGAATGGVMALGLNGQARRSGKLIAAFRARHKVTCCKGLSAGFRWNSPEHLANCRRITVATAEMVEEMLKEGK